MVKGIHFVHRAVNLVSEKSEKYIFFPMVRDPVSTIHLVSKQH